MSSLCLEKGIVVGSVEEAVSVGLGLELEREEAEVEASCRWEGHIV